MGEPGGLVPGLRPYWLEGAGATDLRVDIHADPRISNQRPAWLTDDQQWRDQLTAMDDGDCRWIEKHWDMAGGKAPAVDTSWVTFEKASGSWWGLWPVALIAVAVIVLVFIGTWVVR